ncbi:hypothetical protein BD410DRAFT_893476 [Rickenella mellea]|uniref:RlpA-like protein double-psi beta-barrel domain-containing protein n=1 Tax=Rickenella mellea TaxID=50990 RepID=A0A4Y7QM48_9AGAM|nr:hypothetical protein BD410DRAFT_893476 [Rickenella mellea]
MFADSPLRSFVVFFGLLCVFTTVLATHVHHIPHKRITLPRSESSDGNVSVKRGQNAQFTTFSPGVGACGGTNTEHDYIVALNAQQYGDGSDCWKKITISYGGKTIGAQITDMCPGCGFNGLDLSTALFEALAPISKGVIFGDWWFDDNPPTQKTTTPPPPAASSTKQRHSATVSAAKQSTAGHTAHTVDSLIEKSQERCKYSSAMVSTWSFKGSNALPQCLSPSPSWFLLSAPHSRCPAPPAVARTLRTSVSTPDHPRRLSRVVLTLYAGAAFAPARRANTFPAAPPSPAKFLYLAMIL